MLIDSKPGPYDQFLLFGDSITQQSASQERGFAFMPALQDKKSMALQPRIEDGLLTLHPSLAYIRRLDVLNRGFSGYNSAQALRVLPEFMPSPTQACISFMMVFFGANDACLPSSSTGQHVPLNQYKANLRAILGHTLVKRQQPHLILVTPPPVNEYQLEVSDLEKGIVEIRRTAEHTRKYADACREVGNELGVTVLDLWSTFMVKAGWRSGEPLPGSKKAPMSRILEELLHDGLHFNPYGYKVLYAETLKIINSEWCKQDRDSIPFCFPGWEIAPK